MSASVLVVEDDDGIALPLMRTLEREGYSVERCELGKTAIEKIAVADVDLVILDLGLPDMDGLDVCRRVRVNGYEGAILILTARGGELDRVVGLDVGADDYVAKPFALAELLARTRALLRRSGTARGLPSESLITSASSGAGVRLDSAARRVWQGEEEIALTSKEFDLLALLLDNMDTVVTRGRLMDDVWDENWFGSTKTLDVTVGRLRQKLAAAHSASRIVAVRGVGFRLEVSGSDV